MLLLLLGSGARVRPALRALGARPRSCARAALLPSEPADLLAERPFVRPPRPWSYELRTDDGILLDARDLRERRSDWLRDLLSIGNSRILDSLSERLVVILLWSVFVTALVELDRVAPLGHSAGLATALAMPSWPLEAVSGLLAILLVFRTDQAYDRFWEARQRWADVQAATRSIALLALGHFPPGQARDLLLAYASTFPFALKQHMRGIRDLSRLEESWLPYAAPRLGEAAARSELLSWVNEDNLPAALLGSLSAEVAVLLRPQLPRGYRVRAVDSQGQRQGALWAALQAHVESLTEATTACERLKLTPIPWAYARLTSRYCTLFLLTLPFALIDSELPPWGRPLIATGFGYVLFGLDELGHLIEEPFSLAYARGAAGDAAEGESDAAGFDDNERAARLPVVRWCAGAFVRIVRGAFGIISAALGVPESAGERSRRSAELEVLPLRKYCYIGAHELAELAAAQAGREARAASEHDGAGARLAAAARRALRRERPLFGGGGSNDNAPQSAAPGRWLGAGSQAGGDDGQQPHGSSGAEPHVEDPARYRAIAEAAKLRLELIGDRRL
ncbi:hypothetical protein KFE25_007128 [Diacronema lutheri]|uniref:Bestrophin homolog n=1 Tax=Diacronema lutheri TaxID=2081491 RepID=A0A8J5XSD0_DIALT|nr:hypothetical protein KFE25_007128 [Diacronema lutheri]